MFGKHVIFPFSSINYMFSADYISLLNITYVFPIITCLGFLLIVNSGKDSYILEIRLKTLDKQSAPKI